MSLTEVVLQIEYRMSPNPYQPPEEPRKPFQFGLWGLLVIILGVAALVSYGRECWKAGLPIFPASDDLATVVGTLVLAWSAPLVVVVLGWQALFVLPRILRPKK